MARRARLLQQCDRTGRIGHGGDPSARGWCRQERDELVDVADDEPRRVEHDGRLRALRREHAHERRIRGVARGGAVEDPSGRKAAIAQRVGRDRTEVPRRAVRVLRRRVPLPRRAVLLHRADPLALHLREDGPPGIAQRPSLSPARAVRVRRADHDAHRVRAADRGNRRVAGLEHVLRPDVGARWAKALQARAEAGLSEAAAEPVEELVLPARREPPSHGERAPRRGVLRVERVLRECELARVGRHRRGREQPRDRHQIVLKEHGGDAQLDRVGRALAASLHRQHDRQIARPDARVACDIARFEGELDPRAQLIEREPAGRERNELAPAADEQPPATELGDPDGRGRVGGSLRPPRDGERREVELVLHAVDDGVGRVVATGDLTVGQEPRSDGATAAIVVDVRQHDRTVRRIPGVLAEVIGRIG